ncbi:MAG: hypothetical protein SCALA702_27890 [Melioribacteraceae bacterium]|nr:MAG: hypothetical protein SCALA702_27890 [Melioribacteraceae bacterium]
MRTMLFLLAMLFFVSQASGQILLIKDAQSGTPIELVTIYSKSPKLSSLTNAAGKANIGSFKGVDDILIQMLGYETLHISYNELEDMGFVLKMNPTNVALEQVVISATRWSQPENDVPVKVTTIAPKEVFLQNPQTAADMLTISGEVFMQKSQMGGGSPMIRGFATNRLLLAVDGVRMNNAIFRSGNVQNVISIDPYSIERTEVLFGPGSILYGSDAIGGVMNFYTLRPQLSLGNSAFLKGSASLRHSTANNEMTGNFNINIGWKKFALLTSITYNDYDNLMMGSNGPDEYLRPEYVQPLSGTDLVFSNEEPQLQVSTGYNQFNLLQKALYIPNKDWELVYGLFYSETSKYSRYDRLIRYRNGSPRSAEWYYGPQKWMMHNLAITHHNPSVLYDDLTLRLAYQVFEESRYDRDFQGTELFKRVENVDAYSVNLDFTKGLGNIHTLNYGLEYVYNDVVSTGEDKNIVSGITKKGPSRYPKADWTSIAFYSDYIFRAREDLSLSAGVRYNHFILNAEFDNTFYPFPFTEAELNSGAVTASAGAVYNPEKTWTVSLQFATGFRSPNVDDVGKVFDSEPGAVVVPNPDLKAEYAYNTELGIAKVFNDAVKFDLTGYYTILEDALVRRDFTLNGLDSIMYDGELSQVQAIQNASKATVWGIQAGLSIDFPEGFGLSTKFNYQKGEEELDDGSTSPLRHAAPWFGATHLTYKLQKLNIDLYALYNGEVSFEDLPDGEKSKDYIYAADENGNPYSPAWITLNLKADYQLSDILSISSGVENLTNVRYRTYSSGLVAPGRNFILAMRARF